MLRKDAETFADDEHEHWPVHYEDLEPHYATVEAMQGARPYPPDREPYASTPKTNALLERRAARRARRVPSEPRRELRAGRARRRARRCRPTPNVHDAPRYACRLCGECIVGCQYGAKNTLDYTYLSARAAAGATIRCCCEATLLAPARRRRVARRLPPAPGARRRAPGRLLDPTDEPEREVRAGRSCSPPARSARPACCCPTGRACRG